MAAERLRAWRGTWPLLIAAIVLLGAILRFNGLGWDQPQGASAPLQMHPDERFLSMVADRLDWPAGPGEYFNTATSPLNPYNAKETPSFVYGTLPLFLAKGVSTLAGDDPSGPGNGYDRTVIWGRRLTALFDTATVLLVVALGTTLFGRKAGALGGLLYALAVLPVQLAHFWTVDPFLVFFSALALLLMVRFMRARGPAAPLAYGVGVGAAIGLAMASKVNGGLLLPVFILAVGLRIALRDWRRLGLRWRGRPASEQNGRADGHWMSDCAVLCLAVAAGIVVFRVAQPYAFAGPRFWDQGLNSYWLDDLRRERSFQDGNVDYPPFVQFAGKTPVLEPLRQLVLWGLGPALGLTALAAAAVASVLVFKRREASYVVPLAFAAAVLGFQGPRFVAFMRYFAPMYPVLTLFAGWGLAALLELRQREEGIALPRLPGAGRWLWRRRQGADPGLALLEAAGVPPARAAARPPGTTGAMLPRAAVGGGATAVVAVVLGLTAWWALAFQNVYREEQPRIAASRWIYENLPPGTRITGEFWDDTIPYPLPGRDPAQYVLVETEPYEPDSLQKVQNLVFGKGEGATRGGLNGADYVAITSNRVRDSVKRLEREYPATNRYYQLLDSGELGFELVARFEVRPSFLGVSVDDSGAEESFTVYDHPEVRIYRKTERWDPLRAVALLNAAQPERATNLLPKQGRTNGLQFTPGEWQVQLDGGTFASIFDGDGWGSSVPWLWWLLFLEVAAFATVPWATWLFRALPDRGFGLTKVLGLSSVSLGTWLLVAWGGPRFSAALVWTVFVTVAGLGAALGYVRRAALREEARRRWPAWLAAEAVFLAVFALFLFYRYANPDLWYDPQGGEKFVDLAYLTAVAKSTTLPPYDPWFAGGTMNYYYMGWFMVAVPMRAFRLLPEVGFNLGIPTYAALAAVVAFSTVHNLVALSAVRRAGGSVARAGRRAAILAGLLGTFLLVLASNLDSLHQQIERLQAVNGWGNAWGTGGSGAWGIPVIGELLRLGARMLAGALGVIGGAWAWAVEGQPLPPFDWWRSSRVHPPSFDITEYPYWSYLFGDLHPQAMGLPFFGLVIGLVVAFVVSAARGMHRQAWALAAAMGVALGLVRTVQTWDFPTAVLLVTAGVALGQLLAKGRWQARWWGGLGQLALAAGVLTVLFLPYTRAFEVFDPGLVRARETTPANQQVAQFGVFFGIAVVFLALRTYEELAARRFEAGRNPMLAMVAGWWEAGALAVFLAGLTAFTWRFGLTTVALSAVALMFFANLVWLEWRSRERDVARLLVTGMFLAGIGISAGVDVVNVKNDIVRMNTVFKFGLQAWQLLALASAYATWYSGRALWAVRGWRPAPRRGRALAAVGASVLVGGLLLSSTLYLWPGTRARQEARFADTPLTLDGLRYLDYGRYFEDAGTADRADDRLIRLADDKPIIEWLRANVKGSPVIVEAVGPVYHWNARISVNTGLPTVSGWDWHSIAYRMDYAYLVQQRQAEIEDFYRNPNQARAYSFLRQYNVSYVIVGTEELVHGTPDGLSKFTQMAGLRAVYRQGDYAIYEVAPELRGPAPATRPTGLVPGMP